MGRGAEITKELKDAVARRARHQAATAIRFISTRERSSLGEVSYEIWRGGQCLGTVERYAHPSYRSYRNSRLRGPQIGYARYWRPNVPMGDGVGPLKRQVVRTISDQLYLSGHNLGERTRAQAVELLVAWHDHPERRYIDD